MTFEVIDGGCIDGNNESDTSPALAIVPGAYDLKTYQGEFEKLLNKERAKLQKILKKLKSNVEPQALIDEFFSAIDKHEEAEKIKRQIANLQDISPHIYEKLSNDEAFVIRQSIARNPSVSENLLQAMVNNEKHYLVLLAIINNKNATTAIKQSVLSKVDALELPKSTVNSFNKFRK